MPLGFACRLVVDCKQLSESVRSDDSAAHSLGDLRADAYGHGLIPVARTLQTCGVSRVLVSTRSEAERLRETVGGIDVHVAEPGSTYPEATRWFGLEPGDTLPTLTRFVTEIVGLKRVNAGVGVSYGYSYVTQRPTTLVLAPVGYADGLIRKASNCAPVLLPNGGGIIAGKISMDQCVIAASSDEPLHLGQEICMWGSGGDNAHTVRAWSQATGVPSLWITTGLGRRIERHHLA